MSSETATPTEPCLNCGAVVTGKYCAACGQRDGLSPRSLRVASTEVLGNVFSYDNRFWRTLVLLLFKPGYLSKAYCEGKRTSYMDPLRMFLFLGVLVFFAPDTWTLEEFVPPEAWTLPAEEGASFSDRFELGAERLRGLSRGITEQQFKYLMDLALAESIMFSMTAGILVMALVMRLMHWRSYLVEHIIFGLHFAGFICLSNLILRLIFTDIGNTPTEGIVMTVLQGCWMLVGYQVRYGRPGLLGRLLPFVASVIAFFAFVYPYGIVLQLTLIKILMPVAA